MSALSRAFWRYPIPVDGELVLVPVEFGDRLSIGGVHVEVAARIATSADHGNAPVRTRQMRLGDEIIMTEAALKFALTHPVVGQSDLEIALWIEQRQIEKVIPPAETGRLSALASGERSTAGGTGSVIAAEAARD